MFFELQKQTFSGVLEGVFALLQVVKVATRNKSKSVEKIVAKRSSNRILHEMTGVLYSTIETSVILIRKWKK